MKQYKKDKAGFTLIELMLVVAILVTLSAIAIPNMLRSRIEANEASAIGDLRIIAGAQMVHHAARNSFGDFEQLTSIQDGPGTAFLDESWFDGRRKAGYVFNIEAADTAAFVCNAQPFNLGNTGTRYFRVDTAGIIRYNRDAMATDTDPPVGS